MYSQKTIIIDEAAIQARIFIHRLVTGEVEPDEQAPNVGIWQVAVDELFIAYKEGYAHRHKDGAKRIVNSTLKGLCKMDAGLDYLMNEAAFNEKNYKEKIDWTREEIRTHELVSSALNGGHNLIAPDRLADELPEWNAVVGRIVKARIEHGKEEANATYKKQIEAFPYLRKIVENEPTFDDDLQDITSMPPLPDALRYSEDLIKNGCKWLDDYETFSKKWTPRGYDLFHTCGGLFVLSTLAGRRVELSFGGGEHTQLYIAQVGKSGISKSSTADIAELVLEKAGFTHRLTPHKMTPQSFLAELAGRIHPDYDTLDYEKQDYEKRDYATSGQRGWIFDELGGHLEAILQQNGYMGAFDELFRVFESGKSTYRNTTISRGKEIIEYPYVAVLGNMTFADIKNLGNKTTKLWNNGYFARFLFAVAPPEWYRDDEYPRGKREVPDTLFRPLQRWNDRLAVPDVIVRSGAKKDSVIFERTALPVQEEELQEDIRTAFYRYEKWLLEQSAQPHMEQLASNYKRLAHKALSIALLFASLENDRCIEMQHWAKAQDIVEKMRASLHLLIAALQENAASVTSHYEEETLRIIRKNGEANARTIKQNCRLFKDMQSVHNTLTMLEKSGMIVPIKKKGFYELAKEA